ncbi:hypothetical protein BD626DRAFT_107944 [Schizophyllum amplum]|uniref:Virilizer N-terminal domain-containing protein n=1 Tax=Schizophyllum amplum TaxID=97359 RepID=A0A550CSZ6_9AGAR|nr:hypothetical protein BD626DRAFT_107944 [Auriculariopsis ampla]
MGLLYWCTLQPTGPSSLAAVRFTAPVRVTSIRLFPAGMKPFADYEDFVSETSPDSFYLELFFNANPIHPPEKDKNRFPNSLVPTALAYAGSHVDYSVDMGSEHATRLMIIKGNFERLSLAVYGDLVADLIALKPTAAPITLPSVQSRPLTAALDPANAQNSMSIASQLLTLMSDPPPLHTVLCLMYCLKPDENDWDHADFPNVYLDLRSELENFKLDQVFFWTRPISESAPGEDISAYFLKFAQAIKEENKNHTEVVSRMLRYAASHAPTVPQRLFAVLDATSVLAVESLGEAALNDILDACANVVVARHLCRANFLAAGRAISTKKSVTHHVRSVAGRIVARLEGWRAFETALKDTNEGDHATATRFLIDIGTGEASLGIWLLCMLQHPELSSRLAQRPLPAAPAAPPLCFRRRERVITSDQFSAFVKAFLGASAVVGVACWADCLANDTCFERALAVLRLWQQTEGYAEIANHILSLDQTCRRLKWSMEDKSAPRKVELLAEQILTDLALEPKAVLREELIETILSAEPPLSFITEHDRVAMRKIAFVADDGLPAAVDELVYHAEHPFSFRRLRTVRVSLALFEQALADTVSGEWHVFQALYAEKKQSLLAHLGDLLVGVSQDLNAHFPVHVPPPLAGAAVLNQLFLTAEDLIAVIAVLAGAFQMSGRTLRGITMAMIDIVVCAGIVCSGDASSRHDSIRVSARDTELGCLDLLSQLCAADVRTDAGRAGAELVLRTLLEVALRSQGKDPAVHLAGVHRLVEHVLPQAEDMSDSSGPSYWVTDVLPNVLQELSAFFRALDLDRKVRLLARLVTLDDGLVGVGEWLLLAEIKHMADLLQALEQTPPTRDFKTLRRLHDLNLSVRLLGTLLEEPSPLLRWTVDCLASTEGLLADLTTCLTKMLERQYSSADLSAFADALAHQASHLESYARFVVCLWLLRGMQAEVSLLQSDVVLSILRDLHPTTINPPLLKMELGRTLSTVSRQRTVTPEASAFIVTILDWLTTQPNASLVVLSGANVEDLSRLYDALASVLPSDQASVLENVRLKITVDEDETLPPPAVPLPETWTITLQDLEDSRHPMTLPSTPKRNGLTPDILGPIISPPTALLRSPAATGLTKKYSNNDFRHLRQLSASMQNTSRLPSTHGETSVQ